MSQKPEKQYESPVHHDAECGDGMPTIARFIINEDDARNILKLSLLVKENDLYKVERWDYRAIYLKTEEDGGDDDIEVLATDCDTLLVTENEFQFTGSIRHTAIKVVTDRFPIADLIEHFGVEVTAPLPALNFEEEN